MGWLGSLVSQYKYDIQNTEHVVARSDSPSIVGRPTPKPTGPARTAVNTTQIKIDLYDPPDGDLKFLDWFDMQLESPSTRKRTSTSSITSIRSSAVVDKNQ